MPPADPPASILGLSRRTVLRLSAAAAGLAAVGGAAMVARQIDDPPATTGTFRWLPPRAAATFAAFGDFLVPPGGALPGSGGDATTLTRLDAQLGAMPTEMRDLILLLPLVFEHGTALDRLGSRSLCHLDKDARLAYLTRWAEATDLFRAQLFTAMRTLYGLAYFERPDVVRAMGIAPRCGDDE